MVPVMVDDIGAHDGCDRCGNMVVIPRVSGTGALRDGLGSIVPDGDNLPNTGAQGSPSWRARSDGVVATASVLSLFLDGCLRGGRHR